MKNLLIVTAIAAPLLFSVNTKAEVISSSENGFQLKLEQPFEGSAKTGYNAFVDSVGNWWLSDHTWFGDATKLSIDATAGGCFCEVNGDHEALHMEVTYVQPNKTLRLVGGLGPLQSLGMSGTMTLQFSGNNVTLEYIVGGYPSTDFTKLAPIVDNVLSQQLASLSQYIEKN
ncbi:SRPBCC domain-containing protein [Idiomarina ramblicola]|uniref:Activator of HSP90 ATPase n=1 Tax=Idiomarina ramblicola TaxID=263724 RepID=A0A432YUP1_9GAMM|nr:SRPBCC domain-containing protein [Idiomarina ramblicola]RUO67048.1 activator of HSP90 ATPase [Idiomarina ramblicola]